MSFEGMRERIRLGRVPEGTTCVAVILTNDARYEQDQPSLSYPNVRHTFPSADKPWAQVTEEDLEEWADRIIPL